MSEDQIKDNLKASEVFENMMKGDFEDFEEKLQLHYKNMGKDIAKQSKRLGGDMIIGK